MEYGIVLNILTVGLSGGEKVYVDKMMYAI